MKKTKIIIPALGMLLLSTAASVSGTVAWFSMNNSVTVTGMTVTTKVSSNLQIAEQNIEANYGESIQQARSGIIEPASSVDGVNFFYTTSASGSGVAKPDTDAEGHKTFKVYAENAETPIANTYANKANYDQAFNSAYGFGTPAVRATDNGEDNICYAYIDYSFYIKGTYASASDEIVLSKCDIAYKSEGESATYGAITTAWAWRVGMFVTTANEGQTVADSTAVSSSNLVTILDFEDESKNQNEVTAVQVRAGDTISDSLYTNPYLTGDALVPAGTGDDTGKATAEQAGVYYKASNEAGSPEAVNGQNSSSYALVGGENNAKANAEAIVDDDPAATMTASGSSTQRYKVVIRLWLEGEDISCTSTTFAELTRNWKLDLAFRQGSSETPVEYLSTNA